jgi:hypothetical protein
MTIGAQESNTSKQENESKSLDIIHFNKKEEKAMVGFPGAKMEVQENNDTVAKITIGHKRWEFIEENNKTNVRMVHIPRESFKGHWSGVYLGFCNYLGSDFTSSLSDGDEFMNINAGKSMAFTINFLQYDVDLQKQRNNIGLVTGLGWTVYNYRLDNQYLLQINDDGITYGEAITDKTVEKSKLVSSFINIPILFEAQIPSSNSRSTAYISAGVYGGFRIGSHTKTIYTNGDKQKSRDNINLNPIQYGAMFQVGYKIIKLYATYNFSQLYEPNKGPELYPYSIGLSLLTF